MNLSLRIIIWFFSNIISPKMYGIHLGNWKKIKDHLTLQVYFKVCTAILKATYFEKKTCHHSCIISLFQCCQADIKRILHLHEFPNAYVILKIKTFCLVLEFKMWHCGKKQSLLKCGLRHGLLNRSPWLRLPASYFAHLRS